MEEKANGGQGVLITLAVLLALYLFFPFVYAVPLEALDSSKAFSGRLTSFGEYFFFPLTKLMEVCPPYRKLIDLEGKALSKFFAPDR